jgi:hypothetical protein
VFASLRCNVDRASPSATTGMIEMSSAWRDDSWGTDCSNPFSATGESYKPDHSDNRVPSDEHLGKPGNVGGPGNAVTITRREILHRVPQRLKLTEQQSWQDIAQSKGMTYLQRLPEAIPEGQFLVHNSVRPTHPLGSHGCRPCWWICAGCRGSAISSRMSMHSAWGQGALARHRG